MKKEDLKEIAKKLAIKAFEKLKEKDIPEKLKILSEKGVEKLKEQNISEKLNNLKDKGMEVAKDVYNKNKSADAGWRKFLSTNPKVKYALYGLCGLLVIYCIIPNTQANTQKVYICSDLKCDKNDYCTEADGTPISGICKEYYKSGALQIETNIKNGKGNGISKSYYETGALMAEINLKDGKPEGIGKLYYESGALKQENNYKHGKLEGIYKEYYESGELETISKYKDGKQEDKEKRFYKSGALKSISKYKDGKQEGIRKVYYESGALEIEANWKDGKQNGLTKQYYESGALKAIRKYKDGKLLLSESYDENGDMIDKGYTITLICADGRFGDTMMPCAGTEYTPSQLTISEKGNQRSYSRYEMPQQPINVGSNFQYKLWNGSEDFNITVKIYDQSTDKTYTRQVAPRSWDGFSD